MEVTKPKDMVAGREVDTSAAVEVVAKATSRREAMGTAPTNTGKEGFAGNLEGMRLVRRQRNMQLHVTSMVVMFKLDLF